MLEPVTLSTATIFVRFALVAILVVAPFRVAVAQAPASGSREAGPSPSQVTPDVPAANDEGVVVVTASRREETLLNAPATMTVVTAEAIRDAPSRDIVDLLRAVPGMNVVGTSARDFNVTARASTGTLADSTLVLLDGRSLYQDFFGFVLWDFVPVTVNEFKQIEVIRGPASAVWGANAMNGVINVISRTPREMVGTHVDLEFGQFNRTLEGQAFDGGGLFSINVSHAQALTDRFAFKVSGSMFSQEAFARPVEMLPGTRIPPPRSRTRARCSQSSMRAQTTTWRTGDSRSRWRAASPAPRGSFTPASARSRSRVAPRSSTGASTISATG